MAVQAKGVPGFDERKRVVRAMGVVAFFAVALGRHKVHAEGLFRQYLPVTSTAKPGNIGCQQR